MLSDARVPPGVEGLTAGGLSDARGLLEALIDAGSPSDARGLSGPQEFSDARGLSNAAELLDVGELLDTWMTV